MTANKILFQSVRTGMGAAPAKLAERYWDYAAQCLVIAQRQHNACDKVALTAMADARIALAEQAQRRALITNRPKASARRLSPCLGRMRWAMTKQADFQAIAERFRQYPSMCVAYADAFPHVRRTRREGL